MKTQPVSLLAACLVALGGFVQPAAAAPPTPHDHTTSGNFQTSDGLKGTFVETFSVVDPVTTDTVVYTLADGSETRTVTTVSTLNTDGTKTIEFSDLGFGATVAFTSTTTYTASMDGAAVGTGTFTAVDGTTGTLASVVIETRQSSVNSINFTNATGALTRQTRLEERGGPSDTLKVADVDVLGTLTATTIMRFDDMHHLRHP